METRKLIMHNLEMAEIASDSLPENIVLRETLKTAKKLLMKWNKKKQKGLQ